MPGGDERFCRDCADSNGRCMHDQRKSCGFPKGHHLYVKPRKRKILKSKRGK
jgi:hypothetical protein